MTQSQIEKILEGEQVFMTLLIVVSFSCDFRLTALVMAIFFVAKNVISWIDKESPIAELALAVIATISYGVIVYRGFFE